MTLPWSDLKIAFDIRDEDRVWNIPDTEYPAGWSLNETDSSGARAVAIFRVEGVPTIADAETLAKVLKRFRA